DNDAGQKSLGIARAVATNEAVITAFSAPSPPTVIDPIAERVRHATGAAFVVVANRQGIRYSHPNSALIGVSLLNDPGENAAAILRQGKTYIGVQQGTLGRSMRAKAPIRDARGRIIGLVSVGVLESHVSGELRAELPYMLIPPLLGLVLGVVGSLLLARRIKRQTYGLEPGEITSLLEQREAMLYGVREGTLTLDREDRVTMINAEATRLLGLDAAARGRRLADLVPAGRIRAVLTGHAGGRDEVVLHGQRILVINRIPVAVRGRDIGAVITLRDRTEMEDLLRELDDVRALSDALRAQEHEFSNRLHVVTGLIELGDYDAAVAFIDRLFATAHQLTAAMTSATGEPLLAALLLGKATVASERGLLLSVTTSDEFPTELPDPEGLVTIIGNLIDNAMDAAATGSGGQVDVHLAIDGPALRIRVRDSGPGIDPAVAERIFREGFTTKSSASGARQRRGLGLALVDQEIRRRDGYIDTENAADTGGAVFTVTIPLTTHAPAP
ncbi:MAG: ATP-binding protein, partial [Sciscionella sp.]